MNKIGIIPNTYKDINLSFTKKVIRWLQDNGLTPLVTNKVKEEGDLPIESENINNIYSDSDFLLVLGGDGTVLKVAKHAALHDKPILGINLGTLGYLTDVDYSECFDALKKVLNNEYIIENRMMLEAKTGSTDTEDDTLIALNDVCVTRGYFGGIVSLEVSVNERYIDTYRADGIIVTSPTGSTAYNLSAGGPILKPDSRMMAITPICPHMFNTRSFVVSSDDTVSIKVINKRSNDILLSLDGQKIIPINDQDIIKVTSSEYYAKIIKTNSLGFYDILRKKMFTFKEGECFEDKETVDDNRNNQTV